MKVVIGSFAELQQWKNNIYEYAPILLTPHSLYCELCFKKHYLSLYAFYPPQEIIGLLPSKTSCFCNQMDWTTNVAKNKRCWQPDTNRHVTDKLRKARIKRCRCGWEADHLKVNAESSGMARCTRLFLLPEWQVKPGV